MGAKEQLEALRMMQEGYQGAPIRQPNQELNNLARMYKETNKYSPAQMSREFGDKPLFNIPHSVYQPQNKDIINLGANMLPFIGDAQAVADAKTDYEKGNYGMAAFNAATAIPVLGDIAALTKVGIPAAAGIGGLMRQMAQRSGDVPVTPFGKQEGVIGSKGKEIPFKLETGTPNIDDSYVNKEYFKNKKGVETSLEYMTPKQYISKAAHDFGLSYDDIVWGRTQDDTVEKYMKAMKQGDEFPALYFDYSQPEYGQEGLHRAIAAERLGIEEMPVFVKNKYTPAAPPPSPEEIAKQAAEDKDLLSQLLDDFDPKKPSKSLPMDEAARMARAKEMGFDVDDYYHGSSKGGYVEDIDIKEFDPSKAGDKWNQDKDAFFFTKSPSEASYYATTDPIGGTATEGAIYPVKLKTENPLVIDSATDLDLGSEGTIGYWDARHEELMEKAKEGGHDAIKLIDRRDYEYNATPDEMVAILKNKNIRSKFATFDPTKKESGDLLAGGLIGAIGLKAYNQSNKEDKPK